MNEREDVYLCVCGWGEVFVLENLHKVDKDERSVNKRVLKNCY